MRPQTLGTIGITQASLFNANGKLIGYCLDTPNAIAKAFMECPKARLAQGILGMEKIDHYSHRMMSWNTAQSCLTLV